MIEFQQISEENRKADSLHQVWIENLRLYSITRNAEELKEHARLLEQFYREALELLPLTSGPSRMRLQVMTQRPLKELLILSNPNSRVMGT